MFNTLRNRLILSHILPLLIITPLMGAALLFVFETRIYLPSLASSLESNAYYIADFLNQNDLIWREPLLAQSVLEQSLETQSSMDNTARLMLITPDGQLLASTDRSDLNHLGSFMVFPQLDQIRAGQPVSLVGFSSRMDAEVIDVYVPVISQSGRLFGAVRMTYQYATLSDEFNQVRTLISVLLVAGLLFGSLLGLLLALNIGRSIRKVTQAVDSLAHGEQTEILKVNGPEEITTLARTFNFLVTRLRELEQSRHQLLANLVHEIGRPLGALRSAIQALSQGAEKDPELFHELVEGMNQETARLQHLLNELADLHDQVLGALELNRQEIDLKDWLPQSLRTWQEAAKEKRLHWQMDISADVPPVIADPVRLSQIIGNLVSNAIKFTPTGGDVSISAYLSDGQVSIKVADSGPGISSEEQEKMFTPFYRGAHGRRFPQGMGLGLSIARDLTLAHGGQLLVDSTPGTGSRFILQLPAHKN